MNGEHPPATPSSQRLGELTSPEVAGQAASILFVPLGSTEQHGPHLPLSTDTSIAQAWCDALAAEREDAVVAPPLPYGSSGEHAGFAGTISIGQKALEKVLVELARSATDSFDTVIFVSGHAGNVEPLRKAVKTLRKEKRRVAAILPRLAGADAHAGHTETSLMLHLHPEQVRLDRAEAGNTTPLIDLIDELRSGGLAAVTPNGVLGDPRTATAEDGAALLDALTQLEPS